MIHFLPMTVHDIAEALDLWRRSEGVSLRDADTPEALTRYLERNSGASFVARDGPTLVGVSLAGHDGRRGFLHHVAVAESYRRQGIGRGLVERCLAALKEQGVMKCHILVYADNASGKRFWANLGWHERNGLQLMSYTHPGMDNA